MAEKKIDIHKKFITYIKFKRKQLGYTQEQLGGMIYGNICDKSQKVSKMERGVSSPRLKTVQAYLDVLAKGEINIEDKFVTLIKFKRKELGYSQNKLGGLVFGNITDKTQRISKIERKENSPTLKTVQKFLEVFKNDEGLFDLIEG